MCGWRLELKALVPSFLGFCARMSGDGGRGSASMSNSANPCWVAPEALQVRRHGANEASERPCASAEYVANMLSVRAVAGRSYYVSTAGVHRSGE